MIPLKDDNPARIVPFVTILLILANVAVFVHEILLPPEAQRSLVAALGVTPQRLTSGVMRDPAGFLRACGTLFTAMFLHGNVPHVAMNMLYLWIFGNNVEEIMGHGRYLVFYSVCGLLASASQVVAAPHSTTPMIGASGAISGILGAYLVMFPTARVTTLVFFVVFFRILSIPSVIVLGVWFLLQLLNASAMTPAGGVAVFAHIGGFVSGLILLPGFRRRRLRQSLF